MLTWRMALLLTARRIRRGQRVWLVARASGWVVL